MITTPTTAVAIAAQVWRSTRSRNNHHPINAAENGARLCRNRVVAESIRAIEIINAVDMPAIRVPANTFFRSPTASTSIGRPEEPNIRAVTAATRIPTERHNKNNHSEASPEVHRNNKGLKLNNVPDKKTNADPFRSLKFSLITRDCNDRLAKAERMYIWQSATPQLHNGVQ